jgi:sulfiredoxin
LAAESGDPEQGSRANIAPWPKRARRATPGKTPLANADWAVQGRPMLKQHSFEIEKVRVPVKRRKTLQADKVQALAEDMLEHGQTTPIRVRADGDGYVLIEGMHRLAALQALGEDHVTGYLVHARLH